MKSDLATSIGVAVLGVVVSYFVCNIFIGDIEPAKVKTVDASVSATLADPNPEVFNYKAINPTVEVYVGECTEYSETGECLDGSIIEDNYDNQDFNTDINVKSTKEDETIDKSEKSETPSTETP